MQRNTDNAPVAAHRGFPPRLSGPLAVIHVNVLTMESPRILEDQTVVMEDGLIRAVAPSAAIDVAGMHVIDGAQRYLMPSLADMHTHITDAGVCRLYLANGVTRVRNMDGRAWHLALSHRIERGELPGPRMDSVSPLIDGLNAQGSTARPRSLVLTDPAQAEPLARRLIARGYRELKAYQWLDLESLRALGAAAARLGVRMAGHCPDGITFEQSIDAGMTCFEHLTGIATGHLLNGRQFPSLRNAASRRGTREVLELIGHHLDFDSIRRLAHTMADKRIWNCPTLVVWQKQVQAPDVALADPDLRYEHPSVVHELATLIHRRFASLPCPADEWLALGRARDEALAQVVSILHEEGAPLLLGTDAPNPFVVHGFSIHHELANLVRAGLSPYEALCCGTSAAAHFFGERQVWGSVGVGKRADLILLRCNPFLDITAVRDSLEAVFIDGRYLERTHLDDLLAAHVASLAAPAPVQPDDADRALTVHRGLLHEWSGETHIGTANYCHGALPDGGWQVDERWSRSGPRGPQHCRTQLWLGPDWTVRRAQIESDTDVGRESSAIHWSEGHYRIRVTQADGHTCDSLIATAPLLPSERLSISVLPAWLAAQPKSVTAAVLSIEHEAGQFGALTAEPSRADPQAVIWEVSIKRPGEISMQTYRIADDGTLLHLQDVLFDAARELIAEPRLDVDSGKGLTPQ